MKIYQLLFLAMGWLLSAGVFAADADPAKKKELCGETGEFKAAWTIGEAWGTSYLMSWFKNDATKSVLCMSESGPDGEKFLFKNTYLTAASVKFTAGNCSFDGGPDNFVLAELVDDGGVSTTAFKAWRFDVRTKKLRYLDAGKVECVLKP